MSSAFFYGTLLHPEVLKRVLGSDCVHLKIAPAILLDFTRHHVKGCDYPALVPYVSGKTLFNRELDQEERSVRGSVVSGLTPEDLRILDIFEGDEYTRQIVSVTPMAPFTPLPDSSQVISPETHLPSKLLDDIEVQTYIWDDSLDRLGPELWSFDTFVKEKLGRWVGSGSRANSDYAVVDERRALNGNVKSSSTPDVNALPELGHALLPQFCFRKGYINLNNGSYGAPPRAVIEAAEALTLEIESSPDKFIRRTSEPMFVKIRESLAQLIGANTDEVAMVPNATHGINTVLRNFVWEAGDVLVETTTTYGAISRTVQYVHDLPPHPTISTFDLIFPTSHESILERFRDHLRSISRKPGQKVVAIIDGIVSNPGMVMPWEKMVEICREENVWSVIDAAHCIGQQVDINLGKINPDFWISNCHKWLYAKRPAAVLYVPRRNQHIMQSTLPTSFGYVSPEDPTPRPDNFVHQFSYNGTIDVVPYLSVKAALDFRKTLGGEERINTYCHDLAMRGGRKLAQLLQTDVMDEDGSLTANMTNVRLPLPIPPSQSESRSADIRSGMENKLLDEWNCFAPVFIHDGKWWTRCSAQVWNELADFEYLAEALNAICAEYRNEQV